jgi:histidinol dehydrogenase
MKINKYPQKESWTELLKRPALKKRKFSEKIANIFKKSKGMEIRHCLILIKNLMELKTKNIKVDEADMKMLKI